MQRGWLDNQIRTTRGALGRNHLLTTPNGQKFAIDVRYVCIHGHARLQLQKLDALKAREYGLSKTHCQLLGGIRFVSFCLSTAGAVGDDAIDFAQHLINNHVRLRQQWHAKPWWRALRPTRDVLSERHGVQLGCK